MTECGALLLHLTHPSVVVAVVVHTAMAAISAWYNSQNSPWSRSRRLHSSSLLSGSDPSTRAAAALQTNNDNNSNPPNVTTTQDGTVVINMGNLDDPTKSTNKKKQDTLFGPNIGVINSGPSWAKSCEKTVNEALTPEIVKEWIAKSKQPNQPTTTLQALVNLKRPTIRLSPLTCNDDEEEEDPHHHRHGLEFEFDCDAPKCGIYMHVLLPAGHHLAEPDKEVTRELVFEAVVDGGFGRKLTLDQGAILELGRYEKQQPPKLSTVSEEPSNSTHQQISSSASTNTAAASAGADDSSQRHNGDRRRRFSHFHFRKRSANQSVSGPALALVDADHQHTQQDAEGQEKKEGPGDDDGEAGVRVSIRVSALDEDAHPMRSPNEQNTYLHIVRFGSQLNGAEDTRPWVVRVVKREATIGPHTFHLHEIYGLSSSSSSSAPSHPIAPTAATPSTAHNYPPSTTPAPAPPVHEDEPSSECLLCLSSPREVVLLPCRHLVACRECAVNMIEFGAGGQIVQPQEESTGADTAADGAAAGGEGNGVTTAATTATITTPAPQPRRKRKAKGWFCPVCRQPYTSMLRITTNPPKEDKSESISVPPTAVVVPASGVDPDANPGVNGGNTLTGIASALTPNFLRGLSNSSRPSTAGGGSGGGGARGDTSATEPDLERGEGSGVVIEQVQSRPNTANTAAAGHEQKTDAAAASRADEVSESTAEADHDDASTAASFETAPLVESGLPTASPVTATDTVHQLNGGKDGATSSEHESTQASGATTSAS